MFSMGGGDIILLGGLPSHGGGHTHSCIRLLLRYTQFYQQFFNARVSISVALRLCWYSTNGREGTKLKIKDPFCPCRQRHEWAENPLVSYTGRFTLVGGNYYPTCLITLSWSGGNYFVQMVFFDTLSGRSECLVEFHFNISLGLVT